MSSGKGNNTIYALQHLDEKSRAVYVDCNPPELCEEWYMVGDEGLQNIRLSIVHDVIPDSRFDEVYTKMTEEYGEVRVLGETYPTKPYKLGFKRVSEGKKRVVEALVDNMYYRPNYMLYLSNGYDMSGDPIYRERLEEIENLQEDYTQYILPLKKEKKSKLLYELPEKQARMKEHAFYELDIVKEMEAQRREVEEITMKIGFTKGFMPNIK